MKSFTNGSFLVCSRLFTTSIACLIFIILAFSFRAQAQIVSRDSLVGTWVCIEVIQLSGSKEFDDPKGKAALEVMKKAYLGCTFTFGADGIFRHTLTKTSQDFSEMLKFLNGQKWYFNSAGKSISIGKPSDNLMAIDVEEANNSMYFVIHDLPLRLKMERKRNVK
jgi:hypothetical protein